MEEENRIISVIVKYDDINKNAVSEDDFLVHF